MLLLHNVLELYTIEFVNIVRRTTVYEGDCILFRASNVIIIIIEVKYKYTGIYYPVMNPHSYILATKSIMK